MKGTPASHSASCFRSSADKVYIVQLVEVMLILNIIIAYIIERNSFNFRMTSVNICEM